MCLKEGYKNTKFFHKMASARRRINHIGKIRRGGRVVERPLDIKEEVAAFFESLYRGENVPRPKLEGVYFPSILVENQWWLEKEFEEEVEKALAECGSDKAPDLDGSILASSKQGGVFSKRNLLMCF